MQDGDDDDDDDDNESSLCILAWHIQISHLCYAYLCSIVVLV